MTVPIPKSPCFDNTHTIVSDGVTKRQTKVVLYPLWSLKSRQSYLSLVFPRKHTRQGHWRTKPMPHKQPSPFLILGVLWAPVVSEMLEVTLDDMWTHTAVHCAAVGFDNTQNTNNVFNEHVVPHPCCRCQRGGDGVLGHVCGLKSSGLQKKSVFRVFTKRLKCKRKISAKLLLLWTQVEKW